MKLNKLKLNFLNALDIALIVIAISVLIATLFKIYNRQIFMLFDKTSNAKITLSIATDIYDSSDFKVGEKVFFSDFDEFAGTIISVKDIKEKRYTAINQTLMLDYTGRNVGVLIEINSKIKENQSKKYINSSVFLSRGSKYNLHTKSVPTFECLVEDIIISD